MSIDFGGKNNELMDWDKIRFMYMHTRMHK